eukprot:6491326-Amphidinium_carterae.1
MATLRTTICGTRCHNMERNNAPILVFEMALSQLQLWHQVKSANREQTSAKGLRTFSSASDSISIDSSAKKTFVQNL